MPSEGGTSQLVDQRWLEPTQQAAWRQIIAGATLLLDQLDRDLRTGHDLTLADYEILVHLSEAPDERLRMAELADAALISRSRLTHRVDRLASRGLVAREACPTDKRGMFAVLTPAGRGLIQRSAPTHVASVRRYVVDQLNESELQALASGLHTVRTAICAASADTLS